MEDTNFGINQGNPGQGGTSKPTGKPLGNDGQGDRGNRQPNKPGARPTPSGVPNEGRRMENEGGNQKPSQSGDQQGSRDGQGGMQTPKQGGAQQGDSEGAAGGQGQTGLQTQGEIPTSDDEDDGESAESLRGTAELNSDVDADLDTESDDESESDTNDDEDDDDDDAAPSTNPNQIRDEETYIPVQEPK